MELFDYFRSSAAYRVRITLNLKNISCKLTPVNLLESQQKSEDYLEINAQGLVPTLKLDDGRLLSQSTAILEYLEAEFPTPALLPADCYEAAKIRSLCNIIACDIHPVDNLRILKYLTGTLGVTEEDKMTWYHHWIHEGFKAIEKDLTAAPFATGSDVSMADVYLIPQVFNGLRFNVDMSNYPKISSVYTHCNILEAFQKAAPESLS